MRLRIIVLGWVVRGPMGGLAWHYLQYALGLVRLGHDVWFVEDADDYASCYNPRTNTKSTDPSFGLAFASEVFTNVGLGERWAYYDSHTRVWLGPASHHIDGICRTADVVLNVSGINPIRPWLAPVPVRVLIDTDPAFTQIQHLTDPARRECALAHTAFFTFGENISRGTSTVPSDSLPWQPTRQPVVLDAWPVTAPPDTDIFTTVMLWNSYAPVEYDGRRYGMKSASFEPYIELPRRTTATFELAFGSRIAPLDLIERGWQVRNPSGPAGDPWRYQQYIQASKAEFSVAKHGYVTANTGWFSERSAGYLASGRPVVVQNTGFTEWLPSDGGVLAFSTLDEAIECVTEVQRNYDVHARAAREVAAEYFDSTRVLTSLLARAVR